MNYWFDSQPAPFDATHRRLLLLRGMRSVLLHSRVAKAGPCQAAAAESFIESLRSLCHAQRRTDRLLWKHGLVLPFELQEHRMRRVPDQQARLGGKVGQPIDAFAVER